MPTSKPQRESARLASLKSSGNAVLLTRCATCDSAQAPFGVGVNLRKGKLGVWYCRECWRGLPTGRSA